MTPADCIAKWQASTRSQRAACQEHFLDLCRLTRGQRFDLAQRALLPAAP